MADTSHPFRQFDVQPTQGEPGSPPLTNSSAVPENIKTSSTVWEGPGLGPTS